MNSAFMVMIALITFISTNLDDLFILMAYFARNDFFKVDVIMGQYLGMISLIMISSLAYFFQLIIPSYLIGLLGVFPIIIGVKNLLSLSKDLKSDNFVKNTNQGNKLKFLQVAIVTFANGGDNIGVYAPLFASLGLFEITQVILVFMLMTGLWCMISLKMVDNRILGDKIKKYGHFILPFILISIGVLIIIRGFL